MKLELLDSFGDMKTPLYAIADGTHTDSFFTASANGLVSEWNTESGVNSFVNYCSPSYSRGWHLLIVMYLDLKVKTLKIQIPVMYICLAYLRLHLNAVLRYPK